MLTETHPHRHMLIGVVIWNWLSHFETNTKKQQNLCRLLLFFLPCSCTFLWQKREMWKKCNSSELKMEYDKHTWKQKRWQAFCRYSIEFQTNAASVSTFYSCTLIISFVFSPSLFHAFFSFRWNKNNFFLSPFNPECFIATVPFRCFRVLLLLFVVFFWGQ